MWKNRAGYVLAVAALAALVWLFGRPFLVCALVLAVKSLGEENSFKLFPYLSTLCSLLITGIWVALYVIGFLT